MPTIVDVSASTVAVDTTGASWSASVTFDPSDVDSVSGDIVIIAVVARKPPKPVLTPAPVALVSDPLPGHLLLDEFILRDNLNPNHTIDVRIYAVSHDALSTVSWTWSGTQSASPAPQLWVSVQAVVVRGAAMVLDVDSRLPDAGATVWTGTQVGPTGPNDAVVMLMTDADYDAAPPDLDTADGFTLADSRIIHSAVMAPVANTAQLRWGVAILGPDEGMSSPSWDTVYGRGHIAAIHVGLRGRGGYRGIGLPRSSGRY